MLFMAADLHLTPLIWNDQPAICGDAYAALDQIVDRVALCGKGSALILGGDVFDKQKPDSQSVARLVRALSRLKERAIDVFVIQGQHEKADPPWTTALGIAKYVGDGKPFKFANGNGETYDELTIVGLDYSNAADLKERLKRVERADILILHQMAHQAMNLEGAWDFDIDEISKGVWLVLAGDYHTQLNVGRLWYPGATHMRKVDEVGSKYFLEIKTAGSELKVEPIQLATRQVIEVRVVNDDQLEEAVKTITSVKVEPRPEEIATPLVIAKFVGDVKSVVPRLVEACLSRKFLLRLKTLVEGPQQEAAPLPTAGATLHECLNHFVNREADAQLYGFMSDLLRIPETRGVLEGVKKQLGIGG
jgi:DNA repair exonuclease SbcCD nuclease subunit